ncbi:MAG: hypothetical protein AAGK21_10980 [Bacteroidota bacterium]
MRVAVLMLAFALACPAGAQSGLRLHRLAPADAEQASDPLPVATDPGTTVRVGRSILDVPATAIQTVGVEMEGDGSATLAVWLLPAASDRLASLTAASSGQTLAVVYDGRVLSVPRVDGPVSNGLIIVPGLASDLAGGIARRMRIAIGAEVAQQPQVPQQSDPAPSRPSSPAGWASSSQPPAEDLPQSAEQSAIRFVEAIDRRDWRTAARALHPEAQRTLLQDAAALWRLDGPRVVIEESLSALDLDAEAVVGPLAGQPLSDEEMLMLHLAVMDVRKNGPRAWPSPELIDVASDGDAMHVLFRHAEATRGQSRLTVVTLQRDREGRWRPLATETRGF